MLQKFLRVTVIGASVLALAACGGQNNAGELTQNGYRTNQTGAGQGVRGTTGYGTHNNRNLRVDQDMARAIERLDGISRARVVMGEQNAYVAVELNENAGNNPALGGSNERSSRNGDDFGAPGNYYGATDSRAFPIVRGQHGERVRGTSLSEVGSGASAANLYGYNRSNGIRGSEISGYSGGAGDNGGFFGGLGRLFGLNGGDDRSDAAPRTGATTGTSGTSGAGNGMIGGMTMQQSGLTSKGGVRTGASSATDLGDGRSGRIGLNRTGMNGRDDADSRYMHNGGAYGQMNAYNTNNGLSMQVRARVESVVRSLAPSVRNVYVSADSNFMERLGTYNARSFGGGNNRNDLVTQFNAWVGNLFNMDDTNRYDMNDGYNQRNRNGVTQLMDNSFERNNARHAPGTGGVSGSGTGMNQAQAGTLGSAR